MKIILLLLLVIYVMPAAVAQPSRPTRSPQVKTANGVLEGIAESGIRIFKGIPFAAPSVGDLRWREPQPVKTWTGLRQANKFGPRAMQRPLFGDMNFRSDGMSEDCLYLNVWTPARSAKEHLPVLVYFYGGGLMAGDGSELRASADEYSSCRFLWRSSMRKAARLATSTHLGRRC